MVEIEKPIPEGIEILKNGKTFEVIDVLEDMYLLQEIGVDIEDPYVRIPRYQLEQRVKFGEYDYRGEMDTSEPEQDEIRVITVETIGNYRRVTLRDKAEFAGLSEPQNDEVSEEHSKGSKYVWGELIDGGKAVQAVLVKTQAGDIDYAKETALDIQKDVENDG